MEAPHARLFSAGLPAAEAPKWYYQDLQGQLQGPFDANTMSRWCGENALPRDLKCLGIHSQDSAPLVPSSTVLSHFQPLQKLLENAAAGIQYMPLRLSKGSSEEGPATPQSAAPPKGSRGPGAPGANNVQAPAGATPNGGPDVTRAMDQRSLAAAAAAAAAAAGGMNGLSAQQQQQATGLMAHLQQMQQRTGSQPRQQQQGTPQRAGGSQQSPNQLMHEQHGAGAQQQRQAPGGLGAFMPPGQAAPAGQDGGDEAGELNPIDPAWEPALTKLLKREGFAGKEADVKWRVIVASGDRIGPFSTDQMLDWLLANKPPKGVNKQQAQQTAQNPPALQVAGILTSDYNAQRLPGAKFFKPLGTLLALVAAGMQYQAVNKHDLQRGLPNKGWNEGVTAAGGAAAAKPAGPTPPLPTGKAGKAAKAAARNAAQANNSKQQGSQLPGNRSNSQLSGPRSRSSTPAGMPDSSDGPAPSTSSGKSSSFKHPMALRQQQRQQEALLAAAAGQGPQPGQPGSAQAAAGAQLGKGLTPPGSRGGPQQPGSASRSILTAANMGPAGLQAAGLQAAGLQQQQQLAAAQQVAASRLAQGMGGPQQAFLTPQQQMQAATMAFMQAQPGAMQAVWLKQQQQLPGQVLAGVYPAGQTIVGYAGMPGMPLPPGGAPQGDGGLPRSSSTGSSAQQVQQQQQPPPPSASGAMMQQMVPGADGQAWALQQQAAAGGKARPPGGVPAFAMGQPAGMPGQPAGMPSPQLMHAAALLFMHDQQQPQQQQQAKPDKPQKQWWVQRNELAFSGPFSGLQMYHAYAQPQGALRLTEGTPIAAVAGPPGAQPGARDVPPMRAFAPMSCLLEAAAQGFVLVAWPAAAPGARDSGPSTLLVQQVHTGVTVPLQSVLSQPGLAALQQQQQQPGSTIGEQQGGDGSNDADGARMGQPGSAQQQQQQQQMLAAAKQRQQQPQGPQMLSAVRPAAGGYIQLPNGQLVPAAGLVPVQGGGLAMLQANPAAMAAQPPVVDPLAVASALFTAGGNPHTIVWYIRTDAAAGGEGQQGGGIQGPFDPQEMLKMYRESQLDPSTMLCATHRAAPGQQQIAPPPETFKPLHALMHTVSTPGNDMHGQQQGAASVPGTPAAGAAGMMQQQMVPAGMILAQAPGSAGPVLFQVPVSSGGAGPTVLAMPAGTVQMQQVGPMSGVPHMTGPGVPYMQTPQGLVAQQHMMAVLAAQQQAQQQQQQQQQPGGPGQAGEQAGRPGADNGPASTGGSSSSAPTPQQLAAAGGAQHQAGGTPAGAEAAQRAGAVPPRVDTWGSLAAAQELLQRRPSASSSNGQQTPAAAATAHGMEAALAAAAAAASSRRASVEGHHAQGVSGGMMMLAGGQHMHHHMQQHHHMDGPRSTGGSHHPGGFGGHGHHHMGHGPHSQPGGFAASGPRSTSSVGRHPQDSAAAAAAAASALAGGLTLQGGSSPSFGQMPQGAQQQQMYMQAAVLASMAPQSAAMLQQQQMQMQQQQAALAAVSAAQAVPAASQPAQPPPPPAAAAGQPAQEAQPAAPSEAAADA